MFHPMKNTLLVVTTVLGLCAATQATEIKVSSPDDKAIIVVTDAGGLSYSVMFDGRPVVNKSRFGMVTDGVDLGAEAKLGKSSSHRIH